jgi:RNA polymerase sigma factor (sigma-70 family)
MTPTLPNPFADYTTTRSPAAFRALMERYFDLVYSTALRRTRSDPAAAQDIAQTVFIDLMRSAPKLPETVHLGGWLHRHTCFVASKHLRSARRRQHHETEKARMTNHQTTANDFADIAPDLDDAIDQLPDADRSAIMLRFFEQLDFAAVGQSLNATEDAARMRVNRALDKLRAALTSRGVVIPAAALAIVLTDRAIAEAPAGASSALAEKILAQRPPMNAFRLKLACAGAAIPIVAGAALLITTYANNSVPAAPSTAPVAATQPTTAPFLPTFTVSLTGTRGTAFKGLITADGKNTPVTGTLPWKTQVKGLSFQFAFQKTVAKGNISIEVSSGFRDGGNASTGEPFAGVLSTIRCDSAGIVQDSMFTTLSPESATIVIGNTGK